MISPAAPSGLSRRWSTGGMPALRSAKVSWSLFALNNDQRRAGLRARVPLVGSIAAWPGKGSWSLFGETGVERLDSFPFELD
jgi:hypothetical protein